MRIAIVGAGWFGCHIASSLIAHHHDVLVFEKQSDIFEKASTFNTGRLHQGFHYPRSFSTRKECARNFKRFIDSYGKLCEKVENNFYLVAKDQSLLDFDTYLQILNASGLSFRQVDSENYGFSNIEGAVQCDEYAVNSVKAKKYFKSILKNHLRLNYTVNSINQTSDKVEIDNEEFDLVINASYLNYTSNKLSYPVVYENVLSLLLTPKDIFEEKSFVIMDGNFSSLNRFYQDNNKKTYSLYHVKHSVLKVSDEYLMAQRHHTEFLNMPNEEFNTLKAHFLDEIIKYYPAFNEEFCVVDKFLTIRTKLDNLNADRSCFVVKNNKVVDIFSGKINSIFEAEDDVLSIVDEIEQKI